MAVTRRLWLIGLVVALGSWACDDDENGGATDTGSNDAGDTGTGDGGDTTPVEGCNVVLTPSADAYEAIQSAFQDAASGSVICFEPGTYGISQELSIATAGLTLRGTADGVIFDYSDQDGAANAILVTGNDFTVENIALLDPPGEGLRVEGAENLIFRNVDVSWTAGSVTENGAYAIFPVGSSNILIEDCEVVGASDAGIYVGQSTNIVVRNNVVHGNVAGIEIENSTGAEVYGNHTYDNTAGILVFNLPNLPVKSGSSTRVYDNLVEDNNRPNFAPEGNIVATVPAGTGIMVMAVDQVEVYDNEITGNETWGVLVVSYLTVRAINPEGAGPNDPEHDPYPETIFIHDNTYADNGQAPHDPVPDLISQTVLEDIVWDGATDAAKPNEDGALNLCIDEAESVTFRNFNVLSGLDPQFTDRTPHDCTHDPVPPVELDFD